MALSTTVARKQPIYGPVDASRKEFRLLRILPGSKSGPIRCFLTKHYMHDAPEFLALSYTWGQPDPSCHIKVNFGSLGVTKNLLRFLRHIQRMPEYVSRYFWIDAVCVNQSNTDERGQQVGLMANFYASASLVILWLGPAYADSDVAMRTIAKIGSNLSSQHKLPGDAEVINVGTKLRDDQLNKIWRNRTGLPIRRLCERRYWTRLWVLQELALARDIRVLCGGQQIRWTDLEALMLANRESMSGRREDTKHNHESCMKSPCKSLLNQVAATNVQSSLYDQVLAAQHLRCSDLRDKVYGLLGIAKITPQFPAVADYSLGLVHALHVVIQQDCATGSASTLLELRRRCQTLADVFGVAIDDILSFRDLPTAPAEYLILHEESAISLQWALRLKLGSVIDLWYAEFGMARALQIAIEEKASAATRAILDRWQVSLEVSTSKPSSPSRTWLHVAARCGNDEVLRSLLDRGTICLECRDKCRHSHLMPLNEVDEDGLTALHCAILNQHRAVTDILLDINAVDLEGTTSHPPALVVAAAMATQDSAQDLMRILMARSDINEKTKCWNCRIPSVLPDKRGITPLIAAIKANSMPAMRTLLSGTQTDKHTQATMAMTALLWAVDEGDLNVVTSILGHEDVDVRALYSGHETLLYAADARNENAAIISLLIEGGFDVNATDEWERTLLHLAADRGYTESAALLLKNGANIFAKDHSGRTPLHCAAEAGRPETAALLLENGADISAEQCIGATPLHSAAEFGKANTAAILLKNGADISAEDYGGRRPLHSAAQRGNAEVVALLLKNGADVTAKTNLDETPLHYAVKGAGCGRDVLTMLVRYGAEVNAKAHHERTPLHYFLGRRDRNRQITEAVKTLLALGADPNAQDIDGMKPGDVPKYYESCHDEARQFLEAARGSQKSTSEE